MLVDIALKRNSRVKLGSCNQVSLSSFFPFPLPLLLLDLYVLMIEPVAINAVTDFIFACFPAFIFWRLQMELKIRLTLIAVMGGGTL